MIRIFRSNTSLLPYILIKDRVGRIVSADALINWFTSFFRDIITYQLVHLETPDLGRLNYIPIITISLSFRKKTPNLEYI